MSGALGVLLAAFLPLAIAYWPTLQWIVDSWLLPDSYYSHGPLVPLSFSAYPEEANMHRYYQTLRTLFCTEKSQAWFTTGDHYLSNVRTDDLIQQSALAIPQLVFNMQFSMDGKWLKYHLRLLKHYHELLPANVSFWIVGASTPTFIHNARKVCGARPIYYVSAKPLYLAAKGQELTENGGSKKSTAAKHELLMDNFEQFASTVREYG